MGQARSFKQSGNAFFLILVAVALFAALAYAVTQAIRSKEGDEIEVITELGEENFVPSSASLENKNN